MKLVIALCFLGAGSAVIVTTASGSPIILTNLGTMPQGGIQFEALGATGKVYSLQISALLESWRTVDFKTVESGLASFQVHSGGATARFYRVRLDEPQTAVRTTNYHGWSNSIALSNGKVDGVIVPAIGRIMQFKFSDQEDGPFWENPRMYGQQPAATSWDTAGSFGGDKAWPAPQSVWNWPPPRGFDSMAFTGEVANGSVMLTGPVDSSLGMRVTRSIALHPFEPLMRVSTAFEKVAGRTNQVSVWVVTQVKDAERVFMPVPAISLFPKGYTPLGTVPKGLVVTNGFVSLARDPSASGKVGNDAGALVWVGTNSVLLIESPRVPGIPKNRYPDGGSSAEVYTNPNPAPYIELELLGPLTTLGTNQTVEATSIYSLFPRTETSPLEQAKRILEP